VKSGKVAGRGFHRRFGGPHAEVNAIRSAHTSVRGATLYVNLEPCHVYGKTPPCTDLIIKSGIAHVVVGMKDPNPLISGRGIRKLRRAGIKVTEGVLAVECRRINEFFAKFVTTRLPFVTLKIAQSLDGKISGSNVGWITGRASRTLVHMLRSRYDAVLVGAGTVMEDNPLLTVRHIRGRNPVRIVLDGKFAVSERSAVFRRSAGAGTILISDARYVRRQAEKSSRLRRKGIEILELRGRRNGRIPLRTVLKEVGARGIASLLVEGGASIFGGFLREDLCDKLLVFVAPRIIGKGIAAFSEPTGRSIVARDVGVMTLEHDTLIAGYLH
jgi:diaminohydroxyphosphoribosylaminopyrimidine deaminase/5-amino-6-(5-phosphoribosylamino)uracil reductase